MNDAAPLTLTQFFFGTAGLAVGSVCQQRAAAGGCSNAGGTEGCRPYRPAVSSDQPFIYGGFSRHGANIINHTMWPRFSMTESSITASRKRKKPNPILLNSRAAMAYIHKWTGHRPMSDIFLDKTSALCGRTKPWRY